jgi:hypothetical protein
VILDNLSANKTPAIRASPRTHPTAGPTCRCTKVSDAEYDEANAWLDRAGVMRVLELSAAAFQDAGESADALLDSVGTRYVEAWQSEANLMSYPQAVAEVMEFRAGEGEHLGMSAGERLMTLNHLFLIHRYKIWAVYYVSPTDDNRYQAQKMKTHGLFSDVHDEVGHIIVADVNAEGVKPPPDRNRLNALIQRKHPYAPVDLAVQSQ